MKTGFICGAWDLLHSGHIITLRECKQRCDHLIVGLQVDPSGERVAKNKPIETVFERYVRLSGCKYVDEIIPYETNEDLLNLLQTTPIDVRFLGTDYQDKGDLIIGEDIVHIEYIPRYHTYSTSNLRKRL